jgi:hypothetical protein
MLPSGPARRSWTRVVSRQRQQRAERPSGASLPQLRQLTLTGMPLQDTQVGAPLGSSPGTIPVCPQAAQSPSRSRAAVAQ